MNKLNKKKGFTLIELLVVISIIALLASVVLVSLNKAQAKARDAQRISALQQIQKALILYYDKNGHYPIINNGYYGILSSGNGVKWGMLATDLLPYIKTLPKDPINNKNAVAFAWGTPKGAFKYSASYKTYAYYYRTNTSGSNYDLVTWLESPNNPLSCSKNNWYSNAGLGNQSYQNGYWCTSTNFPWRWIHDKQNLYDINGIKN